jgi:hypothetical protein
MMLSLFPKTEKSHTRRMEHYTKARDKKLDEDLLYLYQPRFEWVYQTIDDIIKSWPKQRTKRDSKVYPSAHSNPQEICTGQGHDTIE